MFLRRTADILLTLLITSFYWAYSRLWLIRHIRRPTHGPAVYAHWHGDELLLVAAYAGSNMAVMASRSRDGERMRQILSWLGYRVVRGSSTRGGAGGLKGLLDLVKKHGGEASLAVDGPHGPIYQVKPGIIKLAQETQLPLIVGAAAASRRFVFKRAWNQCYLPLPFSRCVIVYGDPIRVPTQLAEEEFEQLRLRLERQLLALKEEAEGYFSRSLIPLQLKEPAAEPTGV